MTNNRKITSIEKVLIERDDMSPEDAYEYLQELRQQVLDGDDPEEILFNDLCLEPDYIFDLI